jgi:hypothetical protein
MNDVFISATIFTQYTYIYTHTNIIQKLLRVARKSKRSQGRIKLDPRVQKAQ